MAIRLVGIDRDRAAQVSGRARGFTFHVYNPQGVDMKAPRDVVEAVKYPGLRPVHLHTAGALHTDGFCKALAVEQSD